MPRTPQTRHSPQEVRTGEQEQSGPGHRTRNTTHRATTPVNRSHVGQNTAQATQHNEHAHRLTGAKWPRTPNTQHGTPSVHAGERDPRRPGHHTQNTTQRARTPVIRCQVAQDTTHTTRDAEHANRCTGAKQPRTLHPQHNTPRVHTGEQKPGGPGHRTHGAAHKASKPQSDPTPRTNPAHTALEERNTMSGNQRNTSGAQPTSQASQGQPGRYEQREGRARRAGP